MQQSAVGVAKIYEINLLAVNKKSRFDSQDRGMALIYLARSSSRGSNVGRGCFNFSYL